MPVAATQYDPPWADVFGNGYTNLDTRGSSEHFSSRMGTAGYNNFTDQNRTATTAMGPMYAQSDAVWAFFGHALQTGPTSGGGGVMFCDADGLPCQIGSASTWLWANSVVAGDVNHTCSAPDKCVAGSTGLSDIKFMLFAGCFTAQDEHPGTLHNGNIVKVAHVQQQVDNVWGFTGEVTWPPGDDYAAFLGDRLAAGQTISYSMYWAFVDTYNRWFPAPWASGGWDTSWGQGSSTDKLIPPAYGN